MAQRHYCPVEPRLEGFQLGQVDLVLVFSDVCTNVPVRPSQLGSSRCSEQTGVIIQVEAGGRLDEGFLVKGVTIIGPELACGLVKFIAQGPEWGLGLRISPRVIQ